MDALRNTINTQSVKTKQIVFQYPDGSFPEPGAILNVTDTRGHTDWTRAPNLDSITLVDASGNEGLMTYTDASGLLVNDIPVGAGGGAGLPGTNINITGLGVVNFDPTKGGGVNMLNNPMTNLQDLGFQGSADVTFGGITGLRYDTGTKELTVNPVTLPPPPFVSGQGLKVIGGIKAPNLAAAVSPFANVIGFNTANGDFQYQSAAPTAGTNISVTGVKTVNFNPAGGVNMLSNPITSASEVTFNKGGKSASLTLNTGSNMLEVSSTTATALQIKVHVIDVLGNVGVSGEVLTSQGSGQPPIWAAGGGGGVVLASKTYYYTGGSQTATINTTTFPGIPTTSPVKIRIFSQAGGGGGGGGAGFGAGNPYGGIMSGGGGGGGGAGYTQDYFFDVSYGTVFDLTVGNGGPGGNGANLIFGVAQDGTVGDDNTIQSTIGSQTYTYTTRGGAGGIAGTSGVGGAGDPAGDTAPANITGPGADVTPGGNGGGFYGGLAGVGDGTVPLTLRNAGRGAIVPITKLSGAGGGGGGGGAGSNGEKGGDGASGFIRIDVYA